MYEFNLIASDGEISIGYDADRVAGLVPGDHVQSFEKSSDFRKVAEGYEFCDGIEHYVAESELDGFGRSILFWNKK